MVYFLTFIIFSGAIQDASAGSRISPPKKASTSKYVEHRFGFGVQFHRDNAHFEELPLREGDRTYTISYEYHEGIGFWQLGLGITPTLEDYPSIDKIITPKLALILEDRIYRAGVGILKSYISDKNDQFKDSPLYYQFILGLGFPVYNKFSIDVNSLYDFKKWDDIQFDFKDVEYGLTISFML